MYIHKHAKTHTYCMNSASRRPLARTDNNSMPTPACVSYLVGTGLLPSYFHILTVEFFFFISTYNKRRVSLYWHIFRQAGHKIWLSTIQIRRRKDEKNAYMINKWERRHVKWANKSFFSPVHRTGRAKTKPFRSLRVFGMWHLKNWGPERPRWFFFFLNKKCLGG